MTVENNGMQAYFQADLLKPGRSRLRRPDISVHQLHLSHPSSDPAMPAIALSAKLTPILLLLASNLFMTFAWYGHLRFKEVPLAGVIFASWAIAFIEYCLAVPANRYGHAVYSAAELKTIQEVVTLVIFAGFSVFYLKEPLGWNHAAGFTLIAAGAFLIFHKW